MASLNLKLDAVLNLLLSDPKKTAAYLIELRAQTKPTFQDIRTLVYDLRPPALDELGLIGVIQNHIERQGPSKPHLSLEMGINFLQLLAAFEMAVYRIALEGITNILRHAKAESRTVQIAYLPGKLWLEVMDDGVGLAEE